MELKDGNYLVWDRFDGHSLVVSKDKVKEYLLKPYYFDSAAEYKEYLRGVRGHYAKSLLEVDWDRCFDK